MSEQLAENKKRYRQSRRGAKYLLQGSVKCACCGYSYYGKPSRGGRANGKHRRYTYFRCIGMDAYRFGGTRICDNKQLRTSVLDEAVWDGGASSILTPTVGQRSGLASWRRSVTATLTHVRRTTDWTRKR